jgi:hypothetical protein
MRKPRIKTTTDRRPALLLEEESLQKNAYVFRLKEQCYDCIDSKLLCADGPKRGAPVALLNKHDGSLKKRLQPLYKLYTRITTSSRAFAGRTPQQLRWCMISQVNRHQGGWVSRRKPWQVQGPEGSRGRFQRLDAPWKRQERLHDSSWPRTVRSMGTGVEVVLRGREAPPSRRRSVRVRVQVYVIPLSINAVRCDDHHKTDAT